MRATLSLKKTGVTPTLRNPAVAAAVENIRRPPSAVKRLPPETLKAARDWLREQLPDQDIPLVIGIREQLLEVLPEHIPPRALAIALRERCQRKEYLLSLLVSGVRQGLNGERIEVNDYGHQAHAARCLLERAEANSNDA